MYSVMRNMCSSLIWWECVQLVELLYPLLFYIMGGIESTQLTLIMLSTSVIILTMSLIIIITFAYLWNYSQTPLIYLHRIYYCPMWWKLPVQYWHMFPNASMVVTWWKSPGKSQMRRGPTTLKVHSVFLPLFQGRSVRWVIR